MFERNAIHFVVKGRVQGVGFRWWACNQARAFGLSGWVRNRRDGNVEILAIGNAPALRGFASACERGPAAAHVREVEQDPAEDDGSDGFTDLPTV
jgi:acylphosphatase